MSEFTTAVGNLIVRQFPLEASPVMAWIGQRIALVETAIRQLQKGKTQ